MPESRTRVLQVLGSSAGGVARHVAQISAALATGAPDGPGLVVTIAGPASVRHLVAPADGQTLFDFPFEALQLRQGDGTLQGVHATAHADAGMDVAFALSMHADFTASLG